VGVLLNAAVDPQEIRKQMKDVIELETRIAQITVSSAERRDEEKLYHALTIADLRNLAPFVSYLLLPLTTRMLGFIQSF
jgi:endothelin-converting enzyme